MGEKEMRAGWESLSAFGLRIMRYVNRVYLSLRVMNYVNSVLI